MAANDASVRKETAALGAAARWAKASPEQAAQARRAGAAAVNSPAGLARRIAKAWPTLPASERAEVRSILSELNAFGGVADRAPRSPKILPEAFAATVTDVERWRAIYTPWLKAAGVAPSKIPPMYVTLLQLTADQLESRKITRPAAARRFAESTDERMRSLASHVRRAPMPLQPL